MKRSATVVLALLLYFFSSLELVRISPHGVCGEFILHIGLGVGLMVQAAQVFLLLSGSAEGHRGRQRARSDGCCPYVRHASEWDLHL